MGKRKVTVILHSDHQSYIPNSEIWCWNTQSNLRCWNSLTELSSSSDDKMFFNGETFSPCKGKYFRGHCNESININLWCDTTVVIIIIEYLIFWEFFLNSSFFPNLPYLNFQNKKILLREVTCTQQVKYMNCLSLLRGKKFQCQKGF